MEEIQQNQEALKNELLEAAEPEAPPPEPPKKNTKQAILDKILEVSEKNGIPLQHTNSKLKRMNKQQLAEVLGDVIEEGMKRKMARQVGVDESADNRCIALGALRMLHDLCAVGVEKGGNAFLEPRGYEIVNFSDSLKDPSVSGVIDSCLEEIANENQELLTYIQSPYARLGIAWAGALTFCVRKSQKNAAAVGPRSSGGENTVRRRGRGRPPSREVHFDLPPIKENVKTV